LSQGLWKLVVVAGLDLAPKTFRGLGRPYGGVLGRPQPHATEPLVLIDAEVLALAGGHEITLKCLLKTISSCSHNPFPGHAISAGYSVSTPRFTVNAKNTSRLQWATVDATRPWKRYSTDSVGV